MEIRDLKISKADIAAYGVQAEENRLGGTPDENKKVFDRLAEEVLRPRFNALIDMLLAAEAAGQIGIDEVTGLTAGNVQDALEALAQAMRDMSQGAVADGAINAQKLADGAVTAVKLATGAVTAEKLAGVPGAKLDDKSITSGKYAEGSVNTLAILDAAITSIKLAAAAVTAEKIATSAVSSTKLATGAVTSTKLGAGAVTGEKIAEGAVTGEKIAQNSVTQDKLAALNYEAVGLEANQVRRIFVSETQPSGMQEGDLWLVKKAAT